MLLLWLEIILRLASVFFVFPKVTAHPDIMDLTLLSNYFDQLMDQSLGVKKIQEDVNKFVYSKTELDGNDILESLISMLSDSIQEHVSIVEKLARAVEVTLKTKTQREPKACCRYPEENLINDVNFNQVVNIEDFCDFIAPSAPAKLNYTSRNVLKQMIKNRQDITSLKWQYVANYQGVMTVYPAFNLGRCNFIDPRFRTWYVNTAQIKPRNFLILLDISRSMMERYNSVPLFDIATNLIEIILKTLTPTDKIGVIAFNSTAIRPDSCLEKELGLATVSTKNFITQIFLPNLKPSGESMYKVGFSDAFNLLNKTLSANEISNTENVTIIFISDGKPKERYHNISEVYETIHEGNRHIGNIAKIFVFGVGRNVNESILSTIAEQNFSSLNENYAKKGNFVLINDPEMLENVVSFSNIARNFDPVLNEVVFSAPYIDGGGLGLIFTLSQAVYFPNNSFYGVVGADVRANDLLRESEFLNESLHSYSFIIDNNGRVFSHPLLEEPTSIDELPAYVTIDQLEPDQGFKNIMKDMLSGKNGNMTIKKRNVFPLQDRVKIAEVNATYFWDSIPGTNFTVCVVLCEKRYISELLLENVVPFLKDSKTEFFYHRLDLVPEHFYSAKLCRHFHHKTTLIGTFVIFAPRCYVDRYRYPKYETEKSVNMYKKFFDEVLNSSTAAQVKDVINSNSGVADLFAPGVITDVMWTSLVDALWKKSDERERRIHNVAQRFIGTKTGIFRIYPGTSIRGGYDPGKRFWYQLAEANPGKNVATPPYEDAGGIGNVVSLCRSISISINDSANRVLGVMGLDFSLNYLYSKLISFYPNCSLHATNPDDLRYHYQCFLVDDTGNIILHSEYSNGGQGELRVRHIAEDPFLLNRLIELKFAKMRKCLDLKSKLDRIWYELDNETILDDLEASDPNACSGYFMKKVSNTNIFFLARYNRDWCYSPNCPDRKDQCRSNTSRTNAWLNNCPCSKHVDFDICQNKFENDEEIVPCAPAYNFERNNSDCIPTHLDDCFSLDCNATNRINCSIQIGCVWCEQNVDGNFLTHPHCSKVEECFNGIENNPNRGYDAGNVCPNQNTSSTFSTIQLALVLCLTIIPVTLILIIAIVCYYRRRKFLKEIQKHSHNSADESNPEEGATSPSSSGYLKKESKDSSSKPSNIPIVTVTAKDNKTGKIIFEKPVVLIHGSEAGVSAAVVKRSKQNIKRNRSVSLPPAVFSTTDRSHICNETSNNKQVEYQEVVSVLPPSEVKPFTITDDAEQPSVSQAISFSNIVNYATLSHDNFNQSNNNNKSNINPTLNDKTVVESEMQCIKSNIDNSNQKIS